jgi:hypothetical protein
MYVSIPLFIENFQNFFYNLYSFNLFILKLSNLRNILKIYQATIPEVGHHPLTEMHLNVLSYFKHYIFLFFFCYKFDKYFSTFYMFVYVWMNLCYQGVLWKYW